MFKQLNSIRYMYIRSHLYGLILNIFIMLALLLSVHVWFNPAWLHPGAILFFIASYLLVGFVMAVYAGFKSSGDMKQRMDYISTMITRLARGELSSRLYFNEEDEITGIADELNTLGEKLHQQRESLLKLADEKGELARSAHKAATIEERQRLARDLHDAVSQQLFALTMMAQAADRIIEKKPEQAKKQLKEITQMALQAQTEMRALLLHLRPVHLSGEPLGQGIASLIEELKQKCSLDFKVQMEEVSDLSKTTEEHLFRVVQEALSNILRHANAKEVRVEMTSSGREVFLHIADDGAGFHAEHKQDNKASYGLKTMRERCEEVGGEFTIRSRVGEGTHIDLRVPKQLTLKEAEE
ncbi:sensor histidine kinase [Halobacillus halophilus]|uniref:sensor histidine kinase n=1 Tax=Halobacillus halophilus TaxID=1570 RepID=UPI001CD1FC72|nr:sensor histidine kinase [Halobacillus halophilus]MCA1012085.1 sensor histidine kinase [Halobacillus halophilus]